MVNKTIYPMLPGNTDKILADLQFIGSHVRSDVVNADNAFHRFFQCIVVAQIPNRDVFSADTANLISLDGGTNQAAHANAMW